MEAVASGLTFPSIVTFDEAGKVYILEAGYSYGEVWTVPRLLRLEQNQRPPDHEQSTLSATLPFPRW